MIEFALFFPLLLFAFAQGTKALSKTRCASVAERAQTRAQLNETVDKTHLNLKLPLNFDLDCGLLTSRGIELDLKSEVDFD